MAIVTLPSCDIVHQMLLYDPSTGAFTWKARGQLTWDKRFAGQPAGWRHSTGCLVLTLDYVPYRAHRIAWLCVYGEPVPEIIDHIDGNKLNNSISNLRAATKSQNAVNSQKTKGASGVRGVEIARRQKGPDRYHARIGYRGSSISLGTFDAMEDAVEAYQSATIRLFGKFAPG